MKKKNPSIICNVYSLTWKLVSTCISHFVALFGRGEGWPIQPLPPPSKKLPMPMDWRMGSDHIYGYWVSWITGYHHFAQWKENTHAYYYKQLFPTWVVCINFLQLKQEGCHNTNYQISHNKIFHIEGILYSIKCMGIIVIESQLHSIRLGWLWLGLLS